MASLNHGIFLPMLTTTLSKIHYLLILAQLLNLVRGSVPHLIVGFGIGTVFIMLYARIQWVNPTSTPDKAMDVLL